MKTFIFTTPILICFLLVSCHKKTNNEPEILHSETPELIDESLEKDAILKVIENETDCYFKRDYECWKSYWVQKPYTFQAWNKSDGSYKSKIGWQTINEEVKEFLKENPVIEGEAGRRLIKRNNILVNFYNPSLAYLTWEQINQTHDGESCLKSQETRIMEKIEDEWKIAYISAFWDYKTELPLEELK